MPTPIVIRRPTDVLNQTGFTKSSLYGYIKLGLFPPPISLGSRTRGFLAHEVDAFLAARSNGETEAFLADLVQSMLDARKTRCSDYQAFLQGGAHHG